MATGSRRFDLSRAFSRSIDGIVLLLLVAAGFLILEFCVRPFYVSSPVLKDPQVRMDYSAELGWVMTPDPLAHTLDRPAPIGPDGFRIMGADPGPSPPGASRRRWLLAGGGSAFGVGVDASETFLAIAARKQEGAVALVNAGCEGYDLHQSLSLLQGRMGRIDPDLLIVTFEPEDLPPAGIRDSLFTPERFRARSAGILRQPNPENLWETLKQKSRLLSFLDARFKGFLRVGRRSPAPAAGAVRPIDLLVGRDTEPVRKAWSEVEMEFVELSRLAGQKGVRVCVVVLPFPDQVRRSYTRAHYQSRLLEICSRSDFLFVDPLDELTRARESRERVYLPRRPFLAQSGHRAVARALSEVLEKAASE